MLSVDLNGDLGEGFGRWALGDDEALLAVVTSANVACGFHAGDPAGLLRVCSAAVRRDVAIGAQVGYRDLVGFGRRFLDIDYHDLLADVVYQVGALRGLARVAGGTVQYVKPHGALYHATATHPQQAAAVVDAVRRLDPALALVGPPGSLLLQLGAAAGLRCVPEAFADRRYLADGTLAPRSDPQALLADPAEVVAQALAIASGRPVPTLDGAGVLVVAESIGLHGDSPGAAAAAGAVRRALDEIGIGCQPFTAIDR